MKPSKLKRGDNTKSDEQCTLKNMEARDAKKKKKKKKVSKEAKSGWNEAIQGMISTDKKADKVPVPKTDAYLEGIVKRESASYKEPTVKMPHIEEVLSAFQDFQAHSIRAINYSGSAKELEENLKNIKNNMRLRLNALGITNIDYSDL